MDTGPQRPDASTAIESLQHTLHDLDRLLAELEPAPPPEVFASPSCEAAGAGGDGVVSPAAEGSQALTSRPPYAADESVDLLGETALADVEDSDSLQLIARFLVGAVILGGEELVRRLHGWDGQAPQVASAAGGRTLEDAGWPDLARYWLIGTLSWGRRGMVRALRGGFRSSAGPTTAMLRAADRLTSSLLFRPLRGSLERAVAQFAGRSEERIREGWRDEQVGRWLASQAIPEMVNDFIDLISENPELAALVREQIAAQSAGLATSMVSGGRQLSRGADDRLEFFVRRLLQRAPPSEPATAGQARDARGQEPAGYGR